MKEKGAYCRRNMPGGRGRCLVDVENARWIGKLPGGGGGARWRRKISGGGGRCQVKARLQ